MKIKNISRHDRGRRAGTLLRPRHGESGRGRRRCRYRFRCSEGDFGCDRQGRQGEGDRNPAGYCTDSRVRTKMPRRDRARAVCAVTAGCVSLLLTSGIAWPQNHAVKPIRMLIGFSAGGGADVVARSLTPWLVKALGQPLAVRGRRARRELAAVVRHVLRGRDCEVDARRAESWNPHRLKMRSELFIETGMPA